MIIDGKKLSGELIEEIKKEVLNLKKDGKLIGLSVILIGEYPPSLIYVKNKEKRAKEAGINSEIIKYSADITENEVLNKIKELRDAGKKAHDSGDHAKSEELLNKALSMLNN